MEKMFEQIQVILTLNDSNVENIDKIIGVNAQKELLRWYGFTNIKFCYDIKACSMDSFKQYFLIIELKKYFDTNFKELCIKCLSSKKNTKIEVEEAGKLYWICNEKIEEDIIKEYKRQNYTYIFSWKPLKLIDLDKNFSENYYVEYSQCKPALFLDRDGVINELVFNDDIEQYDSPLKLDEIKIIPRVSEALRSLKNGDYRLIIISNQPAAAKGKIHLTDLYEINRKIIEILNQEGIHFDEIMICDHYPRKVCEDDYWGLVQNCNCRKPKPGLIMRVLEKYNIDLDKSFIIGDSYTDILLGKTLGINSVLVGEMKCEVCKKFNDDTKPDYIVKSLYEFVKTILNTEILFEDKGKIGMEIKEYINEYLRETREILEKVDIKEIEKTCYLLNKLKKNNGRLFIIGVGGSAANASHAVNDFRKICKIEAYTPTDNVAEITAQTNDGGFEYIFLNWLKESRFNSNDMLMVYSVGGGTENTSYNLVLAMRYAIECNSKIVSIVSRDGGYAKKMSTICIHIPVVQETRITAHCEELQGIMIHLLVNCLKEYDLKTS